MNGRVVRSQAMATTATEIGMQTRATFAFGSEGASKGSIDEAFAKPARTPQLSRW